MSKKYKDSWYTTGYKKSNYYNNSYSNTAYASQFNSWYRNYKPADHDEKVQEFKKTLKEEAEKEFMSIHVKISPLYKFKVFKSHRYVLECSPEYVANNVNNKEAVLKLLSCMRMIPQKSHVVHSNWIDVYISEAKYELKHHRSGLSFDSRQTAYDGVRAFFDGKISYEDCAKLFSYPAESLAGGTGTGSGTFAGGDLVGEIMQVNDTTKYKEALSMLTKTFTTAIRGTSVPSIRSGRRINPGYVKGIDWRPLLAKEGLSERVPNVLIIHDCSGSMRSSTNNIPFIGAVSFIGALVHSKIFNVTHTVYHSSSGWEDVKPKLTEGNLFHMNGGDDGFKYLLDNLPPEWAKEADYILFTTDLDYGDDSQKGMFDYLCLSKKHLILSFSDKEPIIQGLNVRKVKTMKEMADAVSTIFNK